MTVNVTAIIPAGGAGKRMGSAVPKQFLEISGLPVFVHTIRALQKAASVRTVILVVPEDYIDTTKKLIDSHRLSGDVKVVVGGETRQDSVRAGLDNIPDDTEYALVHDCARPLVDVRLIENCIAAAVEHGAAIAAIPAGDTLKESAANGLISRTVDRSTIWQAQTPQVAETGLMVEAFARADNEGFVGTDEASLLERVGVDVALVSGSSRNFKITGPDDLILAEALLADTGGDRVLPDNLRIGHGYDAHRLVEGRDLVLGGVRIDHDKGLLGHSDADVLIHALMDALLGAAALGDIGTHFPDSDPEYRGASSVGLLAQVMRLLQDEGLRLVNCDLTVIAQKPKLFPHIPEMKKVIGGVCGVGPNDLNINATTTEEMGYIGREEGIASEAVVLLRQVTR